MGIMDGLGNFISLTWWSENWVTGTVILLAGWLLGAIIC